MLKSSKENIWFKSFYLSYFKAISDFCYAYLKDMENARDVAQEAFYLLWKNQKNEFSEKEKLSFLYTTARNKCFDFLRRDPLDRKRIEVLQNEIHTETFFLDEITRSETYCLLREAIEKLPPRSREVALLVLQGASVQEVADELHISVNSVKTLKKMIYEKLRKSLRSQLLLFLLIKYFL